MALSLCAYINSNFHSVFVPRIAPAMIAASHSFAHVSTVSPFRLCELYSLISAPYTSKSIGECKRVVDTIITEVFRNVGAMMEADE